MAGLLSDRRSTGPRSGDLTELVLLHPLPFDGEIWLPFKTRFQPIATSTPTIYPLGRSLKDIAKTVLDLVESNRLIVVGNSIGGSCAIEVAAAAPDRVEHLILIGTKAGHRPDPDYRDWALNLLANDGVKAVWDQVWQPLFAPATNRSVIERAQAKALAMPPDVLAKGITLFHGRRDLAHVIDEWRKPLTVVTGSHDSAPQLQVSEELAGRAQRGVLRVVPDCGHYVPVEQPDVLAGIIDEAIECSRRQPHSDGCG